MWIQNRWWLKEPDLASSIWTCWLTLSHVIKLPTARCRSSLAAKGSWGQPFSCNTRPLRKCERLIAFPKAPMSSSAGRLQSHSSNRCNFKGVNMAGKPLIVCKDPPPKRNASCSRYFGNSKFAFSKGDDKPLRLLGSDKKHTQTNWQVAHGKLTLANTFLWWCTFKTWPMPCL